MQMVNILKENCDPSKDNNEQLPYNAYLIQYKVGDKEELKWDLVMGHKQSEIFDHYYDNYDGVVSITWTDGIVDPRTYLNSKSTSSKKTPERKKRKREDKKDG